MNSVTIQLGEVEFRAIGQPHAYLLHHLAEVISAIVAQGSEVTGDELVRFLGDGAYDALDVFLGGELSKKFPAYEFHGYPSKEAWLAGEYDEQAALRSPTLPQIVGAFETCIELNGGSFLKKLVGLVDPKVMRALITERVAESLSATSLSSPPTSGTSAPTSSGERPPTPIPNGSGSPSHV